ncbi:MAG: M28 family peptidase [Spirochaetales bacterium]|nr:MAG: M28 family peptidase [Spirochaetales bacterium]
MRFPGWFPGFLELDADRCGILVAALRQADVPCSLFESGAGRFIVARPRESVRDSLYRAKVVTAHYDRVPGTPGALDNSAACLQLWRYLSEGKDAYNLSAVFTDREELSGRPATEQGSFALGKAFGSLGLGAPLVFTLDVTGRGDALVVSESASWLRGEGGTMDRLAAEVEDTAADLLRVVAGRMPIHRGRIPFGEDLGFLRAGLPALALTVLPRDEAEELAGPVGVPSWAMPSRPRGRRPHTWSLLHGQEDTPDHYTDAAFELMEKLLRALGALRVRTRV